MHLFFWSLFEYDATSLAHLSLGSFAHSSLQHLSSSIGLTNAGCEFYHKIAITELQGPLLWIQEQLQGRGRHTHHENNTAAAARIVGANAGCEFKHNTGPPGAPGASAGAPGAARNRVANAGCQYDHIMSWNWGQSDEGRGKKKNGHKQAKSVANWVVMSGPCWRLPTECGEL